MNRTLSKGSSDLDLTIIVDNQILSHQKLLASIKVVLEKHQSEYNRYKFRPNMPRLDKSGYILQFEDTVEKISVDLMVNKTSEIINS